MTNQFILDLSEFLVSLQRKLKQIKQPNAYDL